MFEQANCPKKDWMYPLGPGCLQVPTSMHYLLSLPLLYLFLTENFNIMRGDRRGPFPIPGFQEDRGLKDWRDNADSENNLDYLLVLV